ncbi:hypothetical protein [Auraticoccus monumenti]|uniref:hypothetical protein n=1 Tax=Auraticoccus monumenti TaxID=675864 RepID=UPI0012F974E9|nr:hypothetical protein [Auraticoccus monumenti]
MPRTPLHRRLGRALLGVAAALGALTLVGALLWSQAPEWGIPYARYTNDEGSRCRTTWTGHVCSPLTMAEVDARTGVTFPDGTSIQSSELVQTHDWELRVRLVLPPETDDLEERLEERFGPCRKNQPSPLPPEWEDRCVRTHDAVRVEGQLPPTAWRVAGGRPPDAEQLTLDIDLSSR